MPLNSYNQRGPSGSDFLSQALDDPSAQFKFSKMKDAMLPRVEIGTGVDPETLAAALAAKIIPGAGSAVGGAVEGATEKGLLNWLKRSVSASEGTKALTAAKATGGILKKAVGKGFKYGAGAAGLGGMALWLYNMAHNGGLGDAAKKLGLGGASDFLGTSDDARQEVLKTAQAQHDQQQKWADEDLTKVEARETAKYNKQLEENRTNLRINRAQQRYDAETQMGMQMMDRFSKIKDQELQSLTELMQLGKLY